MLQGNTPLAASQAAPFRWPRFVLAHSPLLAGLCLSLGFGLHGVRQALAHRIALELLWGRGYGLLVLIVGLGALLNVAALVRRLSMLAARTPAEVGWDIAVLHCSATSCWLLYLGFAQPFQRLEFELALSLLSWPLAMWELGRTRWLAWRRRRAILLAALVYLELCCILPLSELALRLAAQAAPSALYTQLDSKPEAFQHLYRAKPGSLRYGFPCTTAGHYDEEFGHERTAKRRVVTIGDSFSMGVVPHAYHFTTVAEQMLGETEVQNLGFIAIGPSDYLALLRSEAVPLRPDLIVINLFVGNDICGGALRADRPDRTLRRWFDRQNLLLWLVPARLLTLRRLSNPEPEESELGLPARSGENLGSKTPGPAPDGLGISLERERLHDPAYPFAIATSDLPKHYPWLLDPMLEPATFPQEVFLDLEVQRAERTCSPTARGYGDLARVLAEMQRLAGPIPLAVLLIPDEFQVEDHLWSYVQENSPKPLERKLPQKRIRAICKELNLPLLDLLPVLQGVPALADGRLHHYHLQDTHFNARGNRATGEALADFIEEHYGQTPK